VSDETARGPQDRDEQRAREELALAERWLRRDPRDRRWLARGVVVALLLHAGVLFARMPDWGPGPKRVEPPQEQAMQVQFLKPPPPPPPKVDAPKPKPQAKKIPMPDPTPTEPEPMAEPKPAPPVVETPATETPPPQPAGPVRVASGQGPGLIKRVEPHYPPALQSARIEGAVVIDAVIKQDGTVGEIRVLESANAIFEKAAVDAIKQWRYTPSSYDVILTVRVNFSLK
jgi:protein TonB